MILPVTSVVPGCARFITFLLMTLLIYAGCAKKMETGDPGPLITLLRCMNSIHQVAVNTEFSNPQKVTISGYTGHAMEPFITREVDPVDEVLFFNSLNDGVDTSLHYAAKGVNDYTFTYVDVIGGVNGSPPHLDAVASMTTGNKFYFISTRSYFTDHFTVYTGTFAGGTVTGVAVQAGDFYNMSPGWLVMDAEISHDGIYLYFVNAHFSGGSVPDQSDIGAAVPSGSDYTVAANSSVIMQNVNTSECLEYAPSISTDGLELFFTRLNLCTVTSEILVAKRASTADAFGAPARIGVITGFVEAPSISYDGKRLYYHLMDNGVYTIYMVARP